METYISEIDETVDLEYSTLEDTLSEMLDYFCEDLSKREGMTRPPNENDCLDEEYDFVWTTIAQRMIESEKDRLQAIGDKYLPDCDIYTSWCIEF